MFKDAFKNMHNCTFFVVFDRINKIPVRIKKELPQHKSEVGGEPVSHHMDPGSISGTGVVI
jgi:hypothetical protein